LKGVRSIFCYFAINFILYQRIRIIIIKVFIHLIYNKTFSNEQFIEEIINKWRSLYFEFGELVEFVENGNCEIFGIKIAFIVGDI
jgi:hypothetical protein